MKQFAHDRAPLDNPERQLVGKKAKNADKKFSQMQEG